MNVPREECSVAGDCGRLKITGIVMPSVNLLFLLVTYETPAPKRTSCQIPAVIEKYSLFPTRD